MIDYRSDTVTQPTQQMLNAMFTAQVGDDVYDEDPTVNALQEKAAELFGHEAALFCPSGTMTNQIAIKVHTRPGGEVICGNLSHIYHYEGGGIAFNSGCSVRLIDGDRGRFTAQQVEANMNNPDDIHAAKTMLVAIENTVNKGGGAIWGLDEIQKIKAVCDQHQLPLHLDGARVFNALVAEDLLPRAIGSMFTSISICLSKGLGCPIGSLLIGSKEFIKEAKRVRKVLGGGMRQAGYLAAAGIYALDHHVERMKEDHLNAKMIAEALQQKSFVQEVLPVETNIVIAELNNEKEAATFVQQLNDKNILISTMGHQKVRFVTHLNIEQHKVEQTLAAIQPIL
tara:strand:- start:2823 stop:3842 length:1020 start_codon:yes stop_codon:yes gene_type:complete